MAAAWNVDPNICTKEEAMPKIIALATSKGLNGAFKVFYEDSLIDDPEDLPESVDMRKVRVSAVLNQA